MLITSGKGGSGKSTFAVNCGAALTQLGQKVLLIDADAGLRALDLMLSVTEKVVYDLSDVLAGRCEPVRAIVETDVPGLYLMSAPAKVCEGAMDSESFRQLCQGLTHYYDFVLIDSPAGVGGGARTAAAAADTAIIIATGDPVCVRDADRIASAVLACGVVNIRLVINRLNMRIIRKNPAFNLDRIIDMTAVQLIGIVPEDEAVTEAVYSGRPVAFSRKGASQAFRNIAGRLLGEDVPLMKL